MTHNPETFKAADHFVMLREVGKHKWLYLDGRGGETSVRVKAARYKAQDATGIAQGINQDNPGTWEARAAKI